MDLLVPGAEAPAKGFCSAMIAHSTVCAHYDNLRIFFLVLFWVTNLAMLRLNSKAGSTYVNLCSTCFYRFPSRPMHYRLSLATYVEILCSGAETTHRRGVSLSNREKASLSTSNCCREAIGFRRGSMARVFVVLRRDDLLNRWDVSTALSQRVIPVALLQLAGFFYEAWS